MVPSLISFTGLVAASPEPGVASVTVILNVRALRPFTSLTPVKSSISS